MGLIVREGKTLQANVAILSQFLPDRRRDPDISLDGETSSAKASQ
jgi:hypothetical protein